MSYLLEPLMTVRRHREDKALQHMERCKIALDQALAQKSRKEEAFCAYRDWRQGEEQRLFQQLQQQPASVHELLRFADTTNTLRENQAAKAQEADAAREQALAAQDQHETARQRYAEAYRQKMKIDAHKEGWLAEHREQTERAAETETEDLAPRAQDTRWIL